MFDRKYRVTSDALSEKIISSTDSTPHKKRDTYFSYTPLIEKEVHNEENMNIGSVTQITVGELCIKEIIVQKERGRLSSLIPFPLENEVITGSGRQSKVESVCSDDDDHTAQYCSSCPGPLCYVYLKFRQLSLKARILILLIMPAIVIMILFIAAPGVCPYIPSAVIPMADPKGLGLVTDAQKQDKLFNILFYGDSMLSAPLKRYDLIGRISKYLPSYRITAKIAAYSAVKMTNLKEHIKDQLKSVPALDGIIIMCDSDITDVVFDKISDDQAAELLSAYTADLIYVIRAAQNASVPLAISSPVGVLLEGPLGAPDSVRYHDKRDAVVAYSEATRHAAQSTGIPYVDVRTDTLAAIPIYRLYYLGCVTYDGEHPNARGTDIFAKLYARVLLQWFYTALEKQRKHSLRSIQLNSTT